MKDQIIKKTTHMRAQLISQLSANYEKLGILFRREVAKRLISQGGPWASFGFVFQDKQDDDSFGPPKVMLASFKNYEGMYSRFSYFNIKNKEEAQKICDLLKETFELE